ncbi:MULTISPECIES: ORF6N domain-containing protein [Paenibacillus]|uniref:ORF6N domain-containing protein n=1 Tax=Paenibacillus TaxID=44249 RepID=UPI0009D69176|nr:ORF6N domain-containing protein [Paenibacillus odorifer]
MGQVVLVQVQGNEKKLSVKECNEKRVVTLKDVDELHRRPEGTARKRFNDNRNHFIVGEDYFVRNSDEARSEFGIVAPNGVVLLTESGYLMLVKSFTDELAWKVQRQLVNSYFRGQGSRRETLQALMAATHNLLAGQELITERLDDVELKLDTQITLDSGQQRRLQKSINQRVCGLEQIKEARGEWFRQLHKEIKDRWNVSSYKDVLKHDLQDVMNYVAAWVPIRREE